MEEKKIIYDHDLYESLIKQKVGEAMPKDLRFSESRTMVRKFKKVYPNQNCTCGSGKKAKKCCYKPYH